MCIRDRLSTDSFPPTSIASNRLEHLGPSSEAYRPHASDESFLELCSTLEGITPASLCGASAELVPDDPKEEPESPPASPGAHASTKEENGTRAQNKRKRKAASPQEKVIAGPSPSAKPHKYHPERATRGLGRVQKYICNYCGYVKTSSSTSSDGGVRIRCPCGGMQADGVSRMHAKWTLEGWEPQEVGTGR
eukprot:TRINITY_DN6204_c0_g1_i2.p2 TRINITY_DN6204_c0_g1~~TRINITY_DN6204_c0_g1_i2.p2  ORF type:complete len:192 (+),score=18.10 TRINITY_DN6204_c0_g1_i2:118-693(+)